MNCKRIRFLMEMIFIFILPLLFILSNISVKNDFVYDNNGNFESSNKYIELNNAIDYIYREYNNIITCDMKWTLYTDGRDICQIDIFNFSKDFIYYIPNSSGYAFIEFLSNDDSGLTFSVVIDKNNNYAYVEFYNERCYISYSTNVLYQDNIYLINFNEYSSCWVDNASEYGFINLEKSFTNYNNNSLNHNSNYKYFDIEYNIFGELKNIITNNLHIDNIFIDIILLYSFIWFIMFIIWHLFYLLLDFLLHFWRKEDDKQ